MQHLPTVLQLVGLLGLALVAFLLYPLAGVALFFAECIYVGYVLEGNDARKSPKD